MLVLSTKPLQKLTGADGRAGRQADIQANLYVVRLRLQKMSLLAWCASNYGDNIHGKLENLKGALAATQSSLFLWRVNKTVQSSK